MTLVLGASVAPPPAAGPGAHPPWRRRLFAAVLVALAVVQAAAAPAGPKLRAAPAFDLPTEHGTVALDSLRGRVVLVDFWASWCTPCRGSFAWLKSMHERYAARGLSIIAIDLDKERVAADDFLADVPAPFTIAFDPRGLTAEAYRVQGMPASFLVDSSGTIVYSHVGFDPHRTGQLEQLIQEACRQ